MGSSQQKKGRRAEIELAGILSGYGYEVRPGKPVSFGEEADIVGMPYLHIEVKRRETVDISTALRQAKQDSERFGDGYPVVFFRGNRQAWRVVMELDEWMNLYRAAIKGGFGRSEGQRKEAKNEKI
ncbi:MAG: hypothetical protein IKE62_01180 [Oscillospiraceae bacterium]|nr:hypothetical protein [Oscillospiraceae bacterium]